MLDARKFGLAIANKRKELQLTQEQLGVKLGVTAQAVSKWERGESLPDVCLLPDLCREIGVSSDRLLDVCQTVEPPKTDPTKLHARNELWTTIGIISFAVALALITRDSFTVQFVISCLIFLRIIQSASRNGMSARLYIEWFFAIYVFPFTWLNLFRGYHDLIRLIPLLLVTVAFLMRWWPQAWLRLAGFVEVRLLYLLLIFPGVWLSVFRHSSHFIAILPFAITAITLLVLRTKLSIKQSN